MEAPLLTLLESHVNQLRIDHALKLLSSNKWPYELCHNVNKLEFYLNQEIKKRHTQSDENILLAFHKFINSVKSGNYNSSNNDKFYKSRTIKRIRISIIFNVYETDLNWCSLIPLQISSKDGVIGNIRHGESTSFNLAMRDSDHSSNKIIAKLIVSEYNNYTPSNYVDFLEYGNSLKQVKNIRGIKSCHLVINVKSKRSTLNPFSKRKLLLETTLKKLT